MEKICNNCGTTAEMTMVSMSSADWQRNEQRHEGEKRRHWILEIILVVLLVASNFGWIYYNSQFEEVEESVVVEQENDNGDNNYIGENGDITYGEAEDND